MLASEGADGDENPLRICCCFPGACSCDPPRAVLLVWTRMAAWRGLEAPVRSRNAWGAACGALRDREASYNTRFGECGTGKADGPWTSSRLMSSKCERSLGLIMSDRLSEWKLDDLLDLELVRSGGLPGASGRYAAAAMRDRACVLVRFCSNGAAIRGEGPRVGALADQASRWDGIRAWT